MQVRIGFIGAGTQTQRHLAALSRLNLTRAKADATAQIVAICDSDFKRAQHLASLWQAKSYSSARKMIEAGGLDAIYICLPPHAHREAETLAAQSGCALLIEPPIAASLETARRIERVLKDTQVLCSVGYAWRYAANFERAQKLIGGRAPSPILLDAHFSHGYRAAPWWKNAAHGGPVISDATPIFDLMRAFGREAQTVFALQTRRDIARLDVTSTIADAGSVALQFRGGAIGQLAWSLHPRASNEAVLRMRAREIELEWRERELMVRRGEQSEIWRDDDDALQRQSRVFLEAVATGKRSAIRTSYADAIKTLKIALAANGSIKSGKIVRIMAG